MEIKVHEDTIKFDKVPAGSLFMKDNTIALMTEYSDLDKGYRVRDAYILGSGEYFCGGDISCKERGNLDVHLVEIIE